VATTERRSRRSASTLGLLDISRTPVASLAPLSGSTMLLALYAADAQGTTLEERLRATPIATGAANWPCPAVIRAAL
jgi:hypothetical protein